MLKPIKLLSWVKVSIQFKYKVRMTDQIFEPRLQIKVGFEHKTNALPVNKCQLPY